MIQGVGRRIFFLLILLLSVAFRATAQTPNTINTIAGGGANSTSATLAFLPTPVGVVRDSANNTYISSSSLNVIYKVTPQGQMSVYAGNGIAGFSGDGKSATQASLDFPEGIALDSAGDLFIADSANNRIRRVDAVTGVITTYAGSGDQYNGVGFFGGYSGDGGPATSAMLNSPVAVALDANGNLFIADSGNNVVRKADTSPQHIITTFAGNGTAGTAGTTNGDGGPATSAQLNLGSASGALAFDSNGNLYIADSNDSVIRVVDTSASHIISTYAGSPSQAFTFSGDGGPASAAGLNFPTGIAFDSLGNLFIADSINERIREVDNTPSHIITTLAGESSICITYTGGCGDGGAPTAAQLNLPGAVFVDSALDVLIADFGTNRIRLVSAGSAPTITTLAGGGSGGQGGSATAALLSQPSAVVTDGVGDLFLNNNFQVNRVDSSTQTINAYAGNGIKGLVHGGGDNGPAPQANINPFALARDSSGNLFVSDSRLSVRRVDAATQTITTYAGTGIRCNPTANPTCGDGGPATSAVFYFISGLATDSQGNLYISEARLHRVRRVDAVTRIITNYAGTGVAGYSGDNGPATSATLATPFGLAFDAQDNLYVADSGNNVIRKIDNTAQHNITTYAFNGLATFGGDGSSALSASMNFPQQVALDANGNLFVGGGFDNVVRRIDSSDQSVITVAGDIHNLDGGFSGDGGPSTQALLSNFGVAVDGSENLYIG
ncbi:MAG TPA: hypothetical protein VLW83_12955, partial [Candidatus Acidoferrales bacterium]|nr:hypothetical protein [Candidatus Acidoferrales bacterium]